MRRTGSPIFPLPAVLGVFTRPVALDRKPHPRLPRWNIDNRRPLGKIDPPNIIRITGQRLGGIDLDAVRVRSAWHDLSMALLKLFLHQKPEVIDAFLRGYFEAGSAHRGAWDAVWIKWFVLSATINAMKRRSIGSKRGWGEAEDNGYKDRNPLWSKRALFTAATALKYLEHPGSLCAAWIRKIAEETAQHFPIRTGMG